MERHNTVDKEAESKTFISPCASFPITWDYKTAKQLQNQTSQHRTSSQNPSPVPFAQLPLPRMGDMRLASPPFKLLMIYCISFQQGRQGQLCQQKARMNNLNSTKGSIQTSLFKQAILMSVIYYLQHLEHVLLLKVNTQMLDSHTQRRNLSFFLLFPYLVSFNFFYTIS